MKKVIVILTILLIGLGYSSFIFLLNSPYENNFQDGVKTIITYKNNKAYIQIIGGYMDKQKYNNYTTYENYANLVFWQNIHKTVTIKFYDNEVPYFQQTCEYNFVVGRNNEALCIIDVKPIDYLQMVLWMMPVIYADDFFKGTHKTNYLLGT